MKRLLISLLLASLAAAEACSAAESEPNDVGSKLTFSLSETRQSWAVAEKNEKGETIVYADPGPVKPMYVAELILRRDYPRSITQRGVLAEIEKSPLAKKLSAAQRQFMKGEYAVRVEEESRRLPKYYPTWLYAVSEADAKLMAQACIDGLGRLADEGILEYRRRLAEQREKLDQAQRDLPKREAELKACEQEYNAAKQARHEFESDDEAAKSSMQTITEMDKALDTLQIELAGIRQKLKTVEQYRKGTKGGQDLSSELYLKLDEMFVEQMIELSGLEARREVAELIRAKEQRFLGLASERSELQRDVRDLKESVDRCKSWIADVQEQLKNPPAYLLPPKVYRNNVTIYRIKGAYTPEELERFKRVGEQMMRGEEEMMKEYQHQMETEMGAEPNQ